MTKRDVRAETFHAVYSVCMDSGLENVTTKRLSEESNCSEAMIYYHFASKKEILEQAFLSIHGEIDAAIEKYFTENKLDLEGDNVFQICLDTWMLYYRYWRNHPARRAFYDAFIHSHYISEKLWTQNNAAYTFFSQMFGKLMGSIAENMGHKAFAFIWPVIIESAIIMARRANETGELLDEESKQMIGRILQSILGFAL